MSQSPFRFVHATNVRIDQPLWGIGEVSGQARRLAEEATNLAFAKIVETCIEHDAACLLLTGNTLDAAHDHRASILLEQACDRLAEQDCQVFLVPGQTDPAHSWSGGHLPSNVTLFLNPQAEPAPVLRDGERLASVEMFQDRQPSGTGTSTHLRIGLVGGNQHPQLQKLLGEEDGGTLDIKHLGRFPGLAGFGYLALGQGSERVSVRLPQGLAHDPGCPQPLDGRQTADLGCTLIEVDREAGLQTRLIPTAIVRREEIALKITEEMDWDALVAAMQTALIDRDPLSSERLWLVRWLIDGEGEVIDSLGEPSSRKELAELIEAELDDDSLLRVHEIAVKSRRGEALDITQAGSVFEEFTTLIQQQAGEHLQQFRRGLPARDWPEAGWVRHIIEAAEGADTAEVVEAGRQLAHRHLLGTGKDAA